MLESDAMDHGQTQPAGDGGVERSAVADRGSPVRQDNVRLAGPVRGRAQPARRLDQVVLGLVVTGVNRVGPHGVMQPFAYEIEIEFPLPWLEIADRLGRRLIRVVESQAR